MAYPAKLTLAMRVKLAKRYVAGGLPAVADDLKRHGLTPQYMRNVTWRHGEHKQDHRRRVTPERRHELLQIYLHMGTEESRVACAEAGVRSTYAESIAHDMGIYRYGNRS